jgi:signal transduction histidine kinase
MDERHRVERTDSLEYGPFDRFVRWAEASELPVDIAVWLGAAGSPERLVALQRRAQHWSLLSLPPLALRVSSSLAECADLAVDRREDWEDLLWSLGMRFRLAIALTGVGEWLVLASRRELSGTDLARCRSAAARLTAPMAPSSATAAPLQTSGHAVHELESLFALMKELTSVESAPTIADAAAQALSRLLRPDAIAIAVRLRPLDPVELFSWPLSAVGDEAAQRATRAISPDEESALAHWVERALDLEHGRLVLGWRGSIPESTPRVVEAASALLTLSFARIAAQRRQEESRLTAVVEALPLGAMLLTPDGTIRLANPAATRLLESVGHPCSTGVRLETLGDAPLGDLVQAAAEGTQSSLELFLPGAGGRHLAVRIVPAANQPATTSDVLLVVDDVTEARRRREQLARAERATAIADLLGGVVHELNSPLGTIIGWAEMLSLSPDAPQRQRWIASLMEEGARARRIVGNLLDVAGGQTASRSLMSLAGIAERALELANYGFRTVQIQASLETDPQTPAIVADRDAVMGALLNLLTNAMHALESTPSPRKVHVIVAPSLDGGAEVRVQDNGPGIPLELQSRIFEPYVTTKERGKGTGLGLALVRNTMSDHSGTIELESEPGAGACFTLRFPAESD